MVSERPLNMTLSWIATEAKLTHIAQPSSRMKDLLTKQKHTPDIENKPMVTRREMEKE